MKQIVTMAAITLMGINLCLAQKGPLRGSGKIVSQTLSDTGFTAIDLRDLDGKITITVGQPYAIRVDIDDNLQHLLESGKQGDKLRLSLKGNRNNRMYIEATRINIDISLPYLSALTHEGNSNLVVNGINSNSLEVKNGGNGSLTLNGQTAELALKNISNGNTNAAHLMVEKATVICRGNGNVAVHVANTLTAFASGNGSITNKGTAHFAEGSGSSGNGRLVRKQEAGD